MIVFVPIKLIDKSNPVMIALAEDEVSIAALFSVNWVPSKVTVVFLVYTLFSSWPLRIWSLYPWKSEDISWTCIPATDVDKDAKDYSKTGLANGATDKKESYNIKIANLMDIKYIKPYLFNK